MSGINKIADVIVSDEEIIVFFADGRKLSTPISWYPRLQNATPEQRSQWQVLGQGRGLHWEEIDEDLSIEGMMKGHPAFNAGQESRQ